MGCTLQCTRPGTPLSSVGTTVPNHRQLASLRWFIQMATYVAGSPMDTANAWIKSPLLVPIPGHRARRSTWGLGASGRTRVVRASRIQDLVGPRENLGPKVISVPLVRPRRARLARVERTCMVSIKTWNLCLGRSRGSYFRRLASYSIVSLYISGFLVLGLRWRVLLKRCGDEALNLGRPGFRIKYWA